MSSRGPFCCGIPEVCGFPHPTQTLAVDGILPGRRLGHGVPRDTQGEGGEKPGLESGACRLGGQRGDRRSGLRAPDAGGDCEVGRMGTHAGAREGRPRTLEGSGSFPQEEKQARRKEGLGVWWAEGLGDEAGDCRSPSACRLLATHHGQVCRAGGSWAGQARQGGWHFSPQSAALRPRMGGARWTDMSSCLGPHGFLSGSPRKKPRVSGLERTVLVT